MGDLDDRLVCRDGGAMLTYDIFGRSAVLRQRALSDGRYAARCTQEDIVRLADIAEYQLGFDMLLHDRLAVVRARARERQLVAALDCLDAALQEFAAHH